MCGSLRKREAAKLQKDDMVQQELDLLLNTRSSETAYGLL